MIKDAGHARPTQYPDKLDKVLQTFLSTDLGGTFSTTKI